MIETLNVDICCNCMQFFDPNTSKTKVSHFLGIHSLDVSQVSLELCRVLMKSVFCFDEDRTNDTKSGGFHKWGYPKMDGL